jgi:molecular chaperone GrpE
MVDEQLENNGNEENELVDEVEAILEETLEIPVNHSEGQEILILEQLQVELDEARAKADEYLDGWQRARAEFANYKKRIEREQSQIYQTTTGSIIKKYLDIVDDLDLALRNRPEQGDGAQWANGIELVYRKLLNILENEGVMGMDVQGQFFDPNLHEAISSEPSDEFESGQIIAVVKQGYMLGDRVLRPALVRVAQ